MRKKSNVIKLMSDFETTVYAGQDKTEVWAAATVPIGPEYDKNDVIIQSSIKEYFDYLKRVINETNSNLIVYFHNLKFDGTFIIDYLMREGHNQNYHKTYNGYYVGKLSSSGDFTYNISEMGQWYNIKMNYRHYTIEFRDSAKLLPFSVRELGEAFNTMYKKMHIEYEGDRKPGDKITAQERDYICADVLIVKECLEHLFSEGHDGLTIGACCYKEWKLSQGYYSNLMLRADFPDLNQISTPWNGETVDEFIRKSYKGGWCYVNPKYQDKVIEHEGLTIDANSMYSSQMHSSSGNEFCIGKPNFFVGMPSKELLDNEHSYFFIRFKCSFNLKPGMLPTVQIKGNPRYRGNEWLTTSDINIKGIRISHIEEDGEIKPVTVELTMTETDFEVFIQHYDIDNFEALGGVWFKTVSGIFDKYIDKYMEQKQQNKGPKREIAKLFLNNLYGKLSSNQKSNNHICVMEDDRIKFDTMETEKESGYIAIGAQITSYARRQIIKYAQRHYKDFCYSDTDSIHMIDRGQVIDIPIDDKKLGYWKIEARWSAARFVRQKTYCEQFKDGSYNVKCCGMTERVKNIIAKALSEEVIEFDEDITSDYNNSEIEFINSGMTLYDFTSGFMIDGVLKSKIISGGVILESRTFRIK